MIFGFIASFLAAFFQATNYILTQRCQQNFNIDGVKLLIAVHVAIGVFAAYPVLFMGYWRLIEPSQTSDILLINLPYLFAQYMLIKAIKLSDASVVSPLLAIKIPVLAMISVAMFNAEFALMQWLSILLILLIAWRFSALSGKIAMKPLLLVLAASVGYSFADMAIAQFSKEIIQSNPFEQSVVTISINYFICGLGSLFLMPVKGVTFKMVYQVKWVAIAWLIAVVFLLIGFNMTGVVTGNVIQSLRGVIGVLLAFFFFRHQINQSKVLWQKKLFGAAMMFVAVGTFYL